MATAPTPTPTPAPTPAPLGTPPAPTPAPTSAPTGMFAAGAPTPAPRPPSTTGVDFHNETVEGRVGQILQTDQRGNYTNPLVRQAVDRQNQAFNARGVLNSSMAMQAGQEAAISKAADIAAADANAYRSAAEQQREREYQAGEAQKNREHDVSMRQSEQDFTLRSDYQKAAHAVNTNFQKMVDTINASGMSPEDKNVAIAQAQAVRDGELTYTNNLYSRMPRWQSEWLAVAVPGVTGGNVGGITNQDTLANVSADPAQPQVTRDAASTQLSNLLGGSGMAGGGGGGSSALPGAADQGDWDAKFRAAFRQAAPGMPLDPATLQLARTWGLSPEEAVRRSLYVESSSGGE